MLDAVHSEVVLNRFSGYGMVTVCSVDPQLSAAILWQIKFGLLITSNMNYVIVIYNNLLYLDENN